MIISLESALRYSAANLSVIPILNDGSKQPTVKWKPFQSRRPTERDLTNFFQEEYGIGLICGSVSGNLETLDFETVEIYERWKEIIRARYPEILTRLVVTQTPGKYKDRDGNLIPGIHVRYRVIDFKVPGSFKLAADETGHELIETRGEGGYALAPGGNPNAHPSGKPYELIQGDFAALPALTEQERNLLIDSAISLNRHVEPRQQFQPNEPNGCNKGTRPGDCFNARADWSFLTEHGWQIIGRSGSRIMWKRPGKETPGCSATTGYCKSQDGTELFYVFSSNASPFEASRCYSPFAAYALLIHGGDFAAAAKSLAIQLGIGEARSQTDSGEASEPGEMGTPPPDDSELSGDEERQYVIDPQLIFPPFPIEALPTKLKDFVLAVTEAIGCPLDFVGCALLVVAAIGIGSTRAIQLRRAWRELPCLFLVIVADPGSLKTPSIRPVAKPLWDWQDVLTTAYETSYEVYEMELAEYEASKKNNPKARKPKAPIEPHVWTSDATTEKLAEMLRDNPRGLGVIQDEIVALVFGQNQYKKGGKGRDRQFWVSVWSSEPFKVDRKAGGTIQGKDPLLSIVGGIQPDMLPALCDELGREDGFVHRFLFSSPAKKKRPKWEDQEISEETERIWTRCFSKLITLKPHVEPDGKTKPQILRMTPSAKAAWKHWYDRLIDDLDRVDLIFRGPITKMLGYAARLILISQMLAWACDEASDEEIDEQSVIAGTQLANYFIGHMKITFTRLHKSRDDTQATELFQFIVGRGGYVTVRQVTQYGPRWIRKKTVAIKALQDLADRGWGEYGETVVGNQKKSGWFRAYPQTPDGT